jgi:hypothetical protein
MAINYAELERSSYSREDAGGSRSLTPEILGKIIAYAWQVAGERAQGAVHQGDIFGFLLDPAIGAPPAKIRDILHVESRVDGKYLEERTRLMVGAQSGDAIGRLNPSHVSPVFKSDAVQANFLLRQHELDFPDEVAWIRSAIESSVQRISG